MTEAAATRPLSGERAQRIVAAMRAEVARRGAAGATFDHVAREAGVSRGLLHYYFGTKERLLVEVVRRECDLRLALLDAALREARTADDVVDALVRSLEQMVAEDPGFIALVFELFSSSRRNPEVAAELGELLRRTREQLGALLVRKQEEGAVRLRAPAEDVAAVLFALADGLALRMLGEPGRDFAGTLRAGAAAARELLQAGV